MQWDGYAVLGGAEWGEGVPWHSWHLAARQREKPCWIQVLGWLLVQGPALGSRMQGMGRRSLGAKQGAWDRMEKWV